MAMKELLRVSLTAKQIREACAEWAEGRTNVADDGVGVKVHGIADDATVEIVYTKPRAPRKPKASGNGVASAGELSEAERRFG